MCYRVARSIAGLAAFSDGKVDAVVLTGGLAFSQRVVKEITRRVGFLAPLVTYPGRTSWRRLPWGRARCSSVKQSPFPTRAEEKE